MLICKICGYKQYDTETITVFQKRFPQEESHDIPYYCGACLDNASDTDYEQMIEEMEERK